MQVDRVMSRAEFDLLPATKEREFLSIGVREAASTQNKVYMCLEDAAGTYSWILVVEGTP